MDPEYMAVRANATGMKAPNMWECEGESEERARLKKMPPHLTM